MNTLLSLTSHMWFLYKLILSSQEWWLQVKEPSKSFPHLLEQGWKRRGNLGIRSSCFQIKQCLRNTGVKYATHPVLPVELHSILVVVPLAVSGWRCDKWPVFLLSRCSSCAHNKPLLQMLTPWTLGWETVHDREHRPIPHNPLHSHLQLALFHSLAFITAKSLCLLSSSSRPVYV